MIEFTFVDWPTTGLCIPYHSCSIFRSSRVLIWGWKPAILRDLWFFFFLDKRRWYLRLFCDRFLPHFSHFIIRMWASRIRNNSVDTVHRLDDRETEFRSPIREWNFSLSVASRSALGYNHTLVQWLRRGFFTRRGKKSPPGVEIVNA